MCKHACIVPIVLEIKMMATLIIHFSFTTTLVVLLLVTQNRVRVDSKTFESDIEVLRSMRQSVDPNSISFTSFFNTWNFGLDPCEATDAHFLGILCSIPEDNSNISRITGINLEGEGLEGFLLPVLGNLTELTLLNLRKNKFRGPLPHSIVNLRKITHLLLSENFFSGSIPNGLKALKRVEIIDLSGNQLTGSIPASLSSSRRLTHLSLSKNEFSGRIPDLTGSWQLVTLDFSNNRLYGNLPPFPKKLTSLLLGNNLLSGHIVSVNRLQHLRRLDLSVNRFSGMIYPSIFTLPELSHMNVSSNQFTRIEVMKMSASSSSKLQTFDARDNQLLGHLPLNLITYQGLRSLNLGHNMFHGEIPLEYWKHMKKDWKRVYLDYNYLEGNVPSDFRSSENRVSLSNNCLTCPHNIPFCHGEQRPASECIGHTIKP